MNKSIYCIGGANVDQKLSLLNPLLLATSNQVKSLRTWGGVARNVAENLALLTTQIHLQCLVGDDELGKQILMHMQHKGVDTQDSLCLANEATSHYYAVIDKQGELQLALADMDIYNKAPVETMTACWLNWPSQSLVFADTNLSENLLQELITISRLRHFQLCIDPVSISKAQRLPSSLDGVFLIKPNQLEAEVLTNMTINSVADCLEAAQRLLKKGVQNVVISMGEQGYVLVNHQQQDYIKVPVVASIVDVNGAGDAFTAGILCGLQSGVSLTQACQLGAAAAEVTLQTRNTVAQELNLALLQKLIKRA